MPRNDSSLFQVNLVIEVQLASKDQREVPVTLDLPEHKVCRVSEAWPEE